MVVLVGIVGGLREQLDDRSERSFEAEDRTARPGVWRAAAIDRRKILLEDLGHLVHVAVVVLDEHGALQHHVGHGFGDLGLAAPRHGAWLVNERSAWPRTDQPPLRARKLLFQPDAESRRQEIYRPGAQCDALRAIAAAPRDDSVTRVKGGVFRDIVNVGESTVHGVTRSEE